MTRIKIELPDKTLFTTEISVMVSDINYGGHVGNDRILTIMHECRLRFLKSLGYDNELGFGNNVGMIVADSAVVYQAEAFHGDVLLAALSLDDFSAYGMDVFYHITHAASGKSIARGKTGVVFFNYQDRKVSRIPTSFSDILLELHDLKID